VRFLSRLAKAVETCRHEVRRKWALHALAGPPRPARTVALGGFFGGAVCDGGWATRDATSWSPFRAQSVGEELNAQLQEECRKRRERKLWGARKPLPSDSSGTARSYCRSRRRRWKPTRSEPRAPATQRARRLKVASYFEKDLHLRAVEHARHTKKDGSRRCGSRRGW